jgi:hypothetical protein
MFLNMIIASLKDSLQELITMQKIIFLSALNVVRVLSDTKGSSAL